MQILKTNINISNLQNKIKELENKILSLETRIIDLESYSKSYPIQPRRSYPTTPFEPWPYPILPYRVY